MVGGDTGGWEGRQFNLGRASCEFEKGHKISRNNLQLDKSWGIDSVPSLF